MNNKEQIILDGVDVSGCHFAILPKDSCPAKSRPYARETSCIACKEYNTKLNYCKNNPNCYFKQLARKTQEYEQLEEKYEALKLENQEGYEIVAELKQECEELKKANQHIDANRQCKGSKLKRIEDLISACKTGYTDEFTQKIYGIIQEPEPTINDYSIIDRCRKALEEIETVTKINCEEICGRKFTDCKDTSCFSANILDIINKAKDCQ